MADVLKTIANIDVQKDPVGAIRACLGAFERLEQRQHLNHQKMAAGAGHGAMGRFAELQGDSESGRQALVDALILTGLPVDIEVVDLEDMPNDVPMRYDLSCHKIEVNANIQASRALMAQYMAEELLHCVDHLGRGFTLSAGSFRMDFLRGDLVFEVQRHYREDGFFAEFFDYPLDVEFFQLSSDRIKAELFARLGVLYFAEPDVLKRELPLNYEVYHECFNLSKESPVSSSYVRGKIWRSDPRGDSQARSNNPDVSSVESRNDASHRIRNTNQGLEQLRLTLAKLLDSPSHGRKAKL